MLYKKQYRSTFNRTIFFGLWIFACLTAALSQEEGGNISYENHRILLPEYFPTSPLIVNPFPIVPVGLVQPLDSLLVPRGIINFSFGLKKTSINLSWDWSIITVSETIDGKRLKIPLTSSVEWYLKILHHRTF